MSIEHTHPIHPEVSTVKADNGQWHVDSFGTKFGHGSHAKAADATYKDNPSDTAKGVTHEHPEIEESRADGTNHLVYKVRKAVAPAKS